ncbi:hypothetical protein A4A49_14277 [Nicotiana attenuata]|uniref:Uncharacterized protein n=1 Tax=Nicotiana attenuata TaxID=49451 RepID=A0A314L297_NICAT|nr:hypothetical protein A4A49_14277 [Nicotiana attenuata]
MSVDEYILVRFHHGGIFTESPNVVEESNITINNPSRATIEDDPDRINGPQPVEEPPLEELETVIGGEGAAAGGKDFSGNVEEEVASVQNLNGGEGANEEEVASEVASSESNLDEFPDEDDSEVNEKARTFRNERTTKKNAARRKKQPEIASVPVGEDGIDKGFEDIRFNKKGKHVGRLGGDEESLTVLMLAVMILMKRKAVDDYAIEYKVQLKLKSNEKDRSAPGGSSSRQEAQGSQSSQPTQRSSICDEATTTVNRGRGRGRGKAPSAAIRPTKGAYPDALPQTAPRGRSPKPKATTGSSSAGKRGRGCGPATAESSATSGKKRERTVGFGCYTNTKTGRTILNVSDFIQLHPGLSSERIFNHGTRVRSSTDVNLDDGIRLPGHRWNGRDAITTSQLQQMSASRRNKVGTKAPSQSSTQVIMDKLAKKKIRDQPRLCNMQHLFLLKTCFFC